MQKQVFVSYSHDSEEHMAWVKRFADDLQEKGGLLVLLDQDLPKGASLPRFMQQGLMISDRVLVIGTIIVMALLSSIVPGFFYSIYPFSIITFLTFLVILVPIVWFSDRYLWWAFGKKSRGSMNIV